jgi:hypothetical protein
MKLAPIVGLAVCAVLSACASAPKSEPASPSASTATSSAALTSSDEPSAPAKTAAEAWAEKKAAAESESSKKESAQAKKADDGELDPLAMGSELEESSIPKTEITPAGQVRAKSPGELTAAFGVVKTESSVEGAAKKLTQRLGKPNWTEAPKSSENAKRHIWVAPAGAQCQRLILEADGSIEVETASKSEWRMLTASARQNPCTGEIKRGITAK